MRKMNLRSAFPWGWQRADPAGGSGTASGTGSSAFTEAADTFPTAEGARPLNWSVINGDTRFILNLFQYDAKADSPNVFANEMFAINPHDTIRTLQYKNILVSKRLIGRLLSAWQEGTVKVNRQSKDFDGWYEKRTAADGKLDFHHKTRDLYNLIRGVTRPFPGAFAFCGEAKVTVWSARPFDEMLGLFRLCAGRGDRCVFDKKPIVRTVDGSLLLDEYECERELESGGCAELRKEV